MFFSRPLGGSRVEQEILRQTRDKKHKEGKKGGESSEAEREIERVSVERVRGDKKCGRGASKPGHLEKQLRLDARVEVL